jgi:hypothetical protein
LPEWSAAIRWLPKAGSEPEGKSKKPTCYQRARDGEPQAVERPSSNKVEQGEFEQGELLLFQIFVAVASDDVQRHRKRRGRYQNSPGHTKCFAAEKGP